MNKGDLIENVAASANLTKEQAAAAVNEVFSEIKTELEDGGKVTILGFGTFSVAQRAARAGRNPKTGEAIQIAAKTVVKFKEGKELKEAIN